MSIAAQSRASEQDNISDLPIVVGKEIHPAIGKPNCPLCEKLAGRYPKDFHWTGWCDKCNGYVTWLMATPGERNKWMRDGEDFISANTITDVPENFKQWCDDNKHLIDSDDAPDFIIMNRKYITR